MGCYLPSRISLRRIVVPCRRTNSYPAYIRYVYGLLHSLFTVGSRVHASFVISVASRACSVQKSAACTPVRLSISHLASCGKINGWPMQMISGDSRARGIAREVPLSPSPSPPFLFLLSRGVLLRVRFTRSPTPRVHVLVDRDAFSFLPSCRALRVSQTSIHPSS